MSAVAKQAIGAERTPAAAASQRMAHQRPNGWRPATFIAGRSEPGNVY